MSVINLKISVKRQMEIDTHKEIDRLVALGVTQISLTEMESMLKQIGLRLDFNINSYAHYYYNDLNASGSFYQLTTQPLDKRGISAYNVGSDWYQINGRDSFTEESSQLRKLRNEFFCLKRYRGIDYIVSF